MAIATFSPGQIVTAVRANELVESANAQETALTAINSALADKAAISHTHQISDLVDGAGFVRMTADERAKLATVAANFKGAFMSLGEVVAAVPVPASGDWAILGHGVGIPATIAVWDSDNVPAAWVDTAVGAPTSIDWSNITSKPTEFPPVAHAHVLADITGLSAAITTFKNRIMNGCMRVNARQAVTATDDTYCFDRWIALTSAGAIGVGQQTYIENGWPYAIRMTQSQAAPQQMGLAQTIEAANVADLRGKSVVLSARVRSSAATSLRFAILEWTGGADNVTSDVVNDWASAIYTPGNFFIATSTVVVASGVVNLVPNTPTDIPALAGVVSGACNNLTVVFWTADAQNQNVMLDIGRVQLEQGTSPTSFDQRPIGVEQGMCRRYYQRLFFQGYAYAPVGDSWLALTALPNEMRTAPLFSPTGNWAGTNVGAYSISTKYNSFGIVVSPAASGMCGFPYANTHEVIFTAEL